MLDPPEEVEKRSDPYVWFEIPDVHTYLYDGDSFIHVPVIIIKKFNR